MTNGNAQNPGWVVTGQSPNSTDVTADGRVLEGTQVFATTGNGTPFVVFVPKEIYNNTDKVRMMLAQQAAAVDAVDNLTG